MHALVCGERITSEGEENAVKWKINLMACVRRRQRNKVLTKSSLEKKTAEREREGDEKD